MDQLPVEISQRIRHEARVAGMHDHAPSIEMVERRRLQLWSIMIIVMVAVGLAAIAVSGATDNVKWVTGQPLLLAGGVGALAVGFCVYAVEKEVHLHRLSRLLVDERILSNTMALQIQMNTALFNAGKALNSVMDLDDVLDAILANALGLLKGSGGSVMLLEDQAMLRVVAVRGRGIARDARVRLGESIVGRVAQSREPLLVPQVVSPADIGGVLDSETDIGGAMCVPLVNRGQLLGVLTLLAPKNGAFDEDDLSVLNLFAEPVAAATAKAGLYEAERANVAKLLESDRMKSQFVASVSHELRTPSPLFGAQSPHRVVFATEGIPVVDGGPRVIMSPGGKHMFVSGGRVRLGSGQERHSCRPSVDVLFESVAAEYGSAAGAVLMTGMGRDGADGLLAIRRVGGRTIAQDEATSVIYGMPRAAVMNGAAESVQPLDSIAAELVRLAAGARP